MSREVLTPSPRVTVLVWQSYGTVRVHPASTVGNLTAILAEISNVIGGWGLDEELEQLATAVRVFVERSNIPRARNELASFCRKHSDHESFEAFEFTNIEELS